MGGTSAAASTGDPLDDLLDKWRLAISRLSAPYRLACWGMGRQEVAREREVSGDFLVTGSVRMHMIRTGFLAFLHDMRYQGSWAVALRGAETAFTLMGREGIDPSTPCRMRRIEVYGGA